ncbi:MAG: ABC transporter ATP-binding protein [Acidimicrobiales bacterium]
MSAAALATEPVVQVTGRGSDSYAVSTLGLTKRFGKRLAVDGLDLRIPAGSITGFVGPNGAGKTTTIRMLLGLIRPSAGRGRVLGHPLGDSRAYLPRVGALIEGPTFYPTLSGRENLMVLARLGRINTKRVDMVIERVGLGVRGLDPFRTYSLGMRQRLGIGAALLPGPELLVLDEPTNGLDPHGIAEIRAMLRSFADDGMTVFVSSHLLAEIQQICEHLVVIEAGRLIFQGGVEELLAARAPELIVRTESQQDARNLLRLVNRIGRSARIVGDEEGTTLEIGADCNWAGELNRLAMGEGITLVHLAERRSTLEEAFFEITRNSRQETACNGDAPGAARGSDRFSGARRRSAGRS